MGWVKVVLTGHKKNGGYLTIMKPNMSYDDLKYKSKNLTDGMEFALPDGPQTLRFDSIGMWERERVQRKLIEARDNFRYSTNYSSSKMDKYHDAAAAADNLPNVQEVTIDVEKNTLVTITVSSNYDGKIIGTPDFTVSSLSDEEVKDFEAREQERIEKEAEAKKKREEERKKEEEERKRVREEKSKKSKKITSPFIALIVFCVIMFFAGKGFLFLVGAGVLGYIAYKVDYYIMNGKWSD